MGAHLSGTVGEQLSPHRGTSCSICNRGTDIFNFGFGNGKRCCMYSGDMHIYRVRNPLLDKLATGIGSLLMVTRARSKNLIQDLPILYGGLCLAAPPPVLGAVCEFRSTVYGELHRL